MNQGKVIARAFAAGFGHVEMLQDFERLIHGKASD
jgi:hypothetical protein